MKTAMKRLCTTLTAMLLPVAVYATCERDLDGLTNNVTTDTTMSADAPGARTVQDFQVATANYFFFTPSGQDYVNNAIVDPGFVSVISRLSDGTYVGHNRLHQVPMCSDVGQCAQGGIIGTYGERELPDGSIEIPIGDGSASVPVDGGTEMVLTGFVVVAEMSDGTQSSQSYSLDEVAARQTGEIPFDLPSVGTPNEAQEGDGCRDNEGNEENDNTDPPGGGGGGGGPGGPWIPPDPWVNDPWWDIPTGKCFRCWATPTGVACKQVARSFCGL